DIMRQGKVDAANLFTDKSLKTLTAEAPPNGQPTSAAYYGPSFPDNLVRADITYLRQDFSMVQQVLDDKSTPFPQRFDFLVRERQLTEEEAQAYQASVAQRVKDSPYREIITDALRGLTDQGATGLLGATLPRTTAEKWMTVGVASLLTSSSA